MGAGACKRRCFIGKQQNCSGVFDKTNTECAVYEQNGSMKTEQCGDFDDQMTIRRGRIVAHGSMERTGKNRWDHMEGES